MASLPQQQQQQDQEERKEDEEEQQPSQSQLPETSEIKRLDDNTIRRITAEQAISDLSSIVKELVDNALDAESTTIKIRLFGQGLDIIEVSDDGNGVPIGSRPYMATRHATSKINCLEDIYRGTGLTMGFRGEALFAMSCVSDSLVVASRTIDDEVATKLTFSGKDGIPEQSIENKQTLLARKIGTTVAVVKPFSNLPARRADIQRRIRQQRTTIFKLVESFGILNVGVCFQLIDINNNREEIVVATSASSKTIKETSSTLLGPSFVRGTTSMNLSFESFFQNIQEQHKGKVVEDNDENENNDDDANDDNCYNWGIRGLISLEPSLVAAAAAQRRHQRGSGRISSSSTAGAANDSRVRNVQYYSINGRVVDLPKVTALLRKLWTTFSSSVSTNNGNSSNSSKQRKKPSAIFEFTLPNNSFDINLSPDKRTVLFTNEQELLSIIEKHVTKLWSNESSSVFVDGGSSSNVAVTQQQQQQRNHQQQRGVPAARVSVDNSCRRCIRGPSYKHGHDTTCFLSQKYNGNGVTKDEKEEEEEHYQDNDDNDIDDDTIDTDIDNSDRMKYKRRFAFVHDLSKAKMQHDLAGRQKEKEHHPQQQQGNDRILRNNNIDNDKNDNNQNYHEDQIEIETEMRHHRRPLLKQSKLSTTVVVLDNNKASNPITMTSTAPETTSANNRSRLLSNNNNNGNKYKLSPGEDDDHPRRKKAQVLLLPEKSQKEKEKSIITTTTTYMESKTNNNNAQSLATTRDHDTSKDCRERLPLLVDKISDLERRKWTEIQSKFNQSGYKDDEGGEEGGLEQQALLQTMISRSISVGGSKNMRTKEPITPDDFTTPDSPPPITTTTTDPQAETRVQTPSLSSSFSSYRKEKRLDDNDDDDDVNDGNAKFEKASGEPLRVVSSSTTTSSTLSSSSFARRPLSANLQQFAFQSNDKDSDNGNVIGIARGIKNSFPPPKETIVSVPTKQTRPKHSKKEENSNEILSSSTSHPSPATATATATATTTRTRTRTRQKVRKSLTVAEEKEKDDNIIPLPLDRETSRRTSTNSIEEQQDTEMASAGASDNCSTTTEDNRVVIWESFGSTEDVCYNARVERLNMRKRKHDIDVIRRNIATKKSDDDNTVGIENSEKMMNEVDKEVGFDDDDDDNKATTRNSSSPLFIRISKSTFRDGMQVIGQFNLGFILARCSQDHLWILDQHACEEKYNFEQLCKKTVMHEQPLIKPLHLELNPSEEACVLDHMDIFQANGFRFDFDAEAPIRHRLSLTALPHSGASEGRKAVQFGPSDVSALCAILTEGSSYDAGSGGTGTDGLGMYGNNAVRRHVNSSTQGDNADRILARLPKAIAMFASRACRTSVMIGTALSQKEMSNIVQKLAHVDMPWTCAHGRPTMRHVASVLPIFLKDERNAAEHIAVPTVTVTPLTQPDE